MNVTYEHKNELTFIGFHTEIAPCYTNGEFIDKVSMEEYIEMCSQSGAQAGMTNEEMKAYQSSTEVERKE